MRRALLSTISRPSRSSREEYVSSATNLRKIEESEQPGEYPLYITSNINKGIHQESLNGNKQTKSLNEILDQVSHLSTSDQKTVLAHLALSADGKRKPEEGRDLDMWSAALHKALEVVSSKQGMSVPGPALIKRFCGAPVAWTPVFSFLEQGKLLNLSVTQRQAVYYMLAELLVEHSVKVSYHVNIPLSAKFVVGQAPHLASIFDQSFPGYLVSGLVHILARPFQQTE